MQLTSGPASSVASLRSLYTQNCRCHRQQQTACTALSESEVWHSAVSRRNALGLLSTAPLLLAGRQTAASPGGSSQNFSSLFEQRVQEIQLPNGLQFLVLQRTNAPIVSCHTHANVGAFDEVSGQTDRWLSCKMVHGILLDERALHSAMQQP
ncbi:hypothetical protein WJX84_005439 [Apatococcus fuscideae]|uniref:Uncharacterized protein n=1 Tax=Apatococcus fuscideae TaxID=2026836 RepID=A0AAW1SML9_9CHLO